MSVRTNSASRAARPGNSRRSSKSITTCRVADDTGKALAIQNINAIHMTTKAVQRLMAVSGH